MGGADVIRQALRAGHVDEQSASFPSPLGHYRPPSRSQGQGSTPAGPRASEPFAAEGAVLDGGLRGSGGGPSERFKGSPPPNQ
jgi:hypothetical protein